MKIIIYSCSLGLIAFLAVVCVLTVSGSSAKEERMNARLSAAMNDTAETLAQEGLFGSGEQAATAESAAAGNPSLDEQMRNRFESLLWQYLFGREEKFLKKKTDEKTVLLTSESGRKLTVCYDRTDAANGLLGVTVSEEYPTFPGKKGTVKKSGVILFEEEVEPQLYAISYQMPDYCTKVYRQQEGKIMKVPSGEEMTEETRWRVADSSDPSEFPSGEVLTSKELKSRRVCCSLTLTMISADETA